MISLNTSGLAQFEVELQAAISQLEKEMSDKFTSFTRKVFAELVTGSPQWSSNLAGNWNYSVLKPDESYTRSVLKLAKAHKVARVFSRGEEPIISITLARMTEVAPPAWRDAVYATNATPDEDGNFLEELLERRLVRIRPVNLLSGKVTLIDYTVQINQGVLL